jgi:hypothetical protein
MSWFEQDSRTGDAVLTAPVSRQNSLQTGNFTGNLAILAARRPDYGLETLYCSAFWANSLHQLSGNFIWRTGYRRERNRESGRLPNRGCRSVVCGSRLKGITELERSGLLLNLRPIGVSEPFEPPPPDWTGREPLVAAVRSDARFTLDSDPAPACNDAWRPSRRYECPWSFSRGQRGSLATKSARSGHREAVPSGRTCMRLD